MPSSIEWITGPVHTGKTTRLGERIAANQSQYCGLLAPVDAAGKRYLQDIVTSERRMLDCSPQAKEVVLVGPYTFSGEVFAWGRSVLADHHANYPNRTLVIDEIGKLELKGEGLADICWKVIEARENSKTPLILVVRDSLVFAVTNQILSNLS